MYAHIDGILSEKNADTLVIDCAGIGFEMMVSANTLAAAPSIGQPMKCYTILNVREDAMELVGFATREEKTMFQKLRTVTGVGTKMALGLLSALSVRDLSLALVLGDANAISRAPGIGKKTAQRLILELKEKIDNSEITSEAGAEAVTALPQGNIESDAMDALMALGYTQAEAAKSVSRVAGKADNVNELITLALKGMGV